MFNRKTKAKEAFRLANDLMLDLISATKLYQVLIGLAERLPPAESVRIGINKVCLSHIMIALSKWCEFYDRYKAVIPDEVRQSAKELTVELKNRGIPAYRNVVVGHIWDRNTGRPLTMDEVESRLASITGGDIDGFLRWVNDSTGNVFPTTVVSIVERVRDLIQQDCSLTESDLIA